MTSWFARPVLHVRDVAASIAFYVDRLGFTRAWSYDENRAPAVAQVEREAARSSSPVSGPTRSARR